MNAKELRVLDNEELVRKEADLREEMFNLRLQLASGSLPGPDSITKAKRDIARVKTILRERGTKKNAS